MTENNVEFKPWGKTPRLKYFNVSISYKYDGTNSCIIIRDGEIVGCQSRNRLITPDKDNMGFANWVEENKETLVKLGEGYHYGEWVGPGIQKNPHNFDRKYFYLFNPYMSGCIEAHPELSDVGVRVAQVMYVGPYSDAAVKDCLDQLDVSKGDEGIILYFTTMRYTAKITLKNPDGKWKNEKEN